MDARSESKPTAEKLSAGRSDSSTSDEDYAETTMASPIDSEKARPRDQTFSPIKSQGQAPSRPHSLRPVRSQRSYGGEDGYSCHRGSVDGNPPPEGVEDDQFTVRFRGDDDPDSPRSRSKLRKWIVVLIMAVSALNVYATSIFVKSAPRTNNPQHLRIIDVHTYLQSVDCRISCLQISSDGRLVHVCCWVRIGTNGTLMTMCTHEANSVQFLAPLSEVRSL